MEIRDQILDRLKPMSSNAFHLFLSRQWVVPALVAIICLSNSIAAAGQSTTAKPKSNSGASKVEISDKAKELGFDVKKLKSIDHKLQAKMCPRTLPKCGLWAGQFGLGCYCH